MTVKDIQTGQARWQFKPDCDLIRVSAFEMTVIGERVYAVSARNVLFALDAMTGRALWQKRLSAKPISTLEAVGDTG